MQDTTDAETINTITLHLKSSPTVYVQARGFIPHIQRNIKKTRLYGGFSPSLYRHQKYEGNRFLAISDKKSQLIQFILQMLSHRKAISVTISIS